MKKLLFFLLFFPSLNLYSFTSKSDTLGDYHFKRAEDLYKNGMYDSSSYHYNLAAEKFRDEERWIDCIISKNYSGTNYRYLSKIEDSFKLLNEALTICLNKFGNRDSLLADIYNSIGSVYYDKEDFENALQNYEKSLLISLHHWGDNHKKTGRGYHNIGLIYYRTGDASEALQHFNKALATWLPISGEKTSNIGNCYINLANTYFMMEDYDKAIEYDLKALEVWKEVLGEEHQYIAMSYTNLADDYATVGKFKESLTFFEKALTLRKKLFGNNHPETAFSISNIAKLYIKMGEVKKSQAFFDSAFVIFNQIPSHPNKFTACLEQGRLNLLTGEFDKAIKNFDQVLSYILPGINEESFNIDSISASEYSSTKFGLWTALECKGDAFYKKYLLHSEITYLFNAFKWYQIFADVLRNIRKSYRSDASKIILGKNVFDVNSKLIKTAVNLYELTGEEKYKEKAFNFSEESKSTVLNGAIKESGAKKFAGIPDSLLVKEKFLKNELSYLDTKIQEAEEEKENTAALLDMKKKLFDLNAEYNNLVSFFDLNFPKYFNLKYEIKDLSVKEIQKGLDVNLSLIEYFISDSLIYIFSLNKNKLDVKYLRNPGLDDIIKEFREALHNLDINSYLNSANKLYSLLIKPIEETISGRKKIHIIPDGILNYLPFEAFLTEVPRNIGNVEFSNLSYLINNYEISYYFSAATLMDNMEREKNVSENFIGFAPVFSEEKSKTKILSVIENSNLVSSTRNINIDGYIYSSLPESEKELKSIFNLFNEKDINAKIFLHSSAKEEVIKSDEIKNYKYIHIASHGFINEEKPKLSGIIFTAEDDSSKEDGILYTNEIYNLNLNADLAVLSACESGLGKIAKGEGIIGLTRGFIYSGVKNIIVSLWQVADESTSELMIEFYKNFLKGKSFSAALREAKIKLIKEGDFSYPLEWSPFILVGR